jgi:hypothetical protein
MTDKERKTDHYVVQAAAVLSDVQSRLLKTALRRGSTPELRRDMKAKLKWASDFIEHIPDYYEDESQQQETDHGN